MPTWHITPHTTAALWLALAAHYGTRTWPKFRAPQMHATGALCGALGILPYTRFMRQYTTVWGRTLYPCFSPGQGDQAALWRQVVVGVHEHQHVVQYDRMGFAHFTVRYVLSTRERALLEAEAYVCNLELAWVRFGHLPPLAPLAAKLGDYGCSRADQAAALAHYEHLAPAITQGVLHNQATQVALGLMEEVGMWEKS